MGTRDLSRDHRERLVTSPLPLHSIGVDQDRVRHTVPLAHQLCAGLQSDRRRRFDAAAGDDCRVRRRGSWRTAKLFFRRYLYCRPSGARTPFRFNLMVLQARERPRLERMCASQQGQARSAMRSLLSKLGVVARWCEEASMRIAATPSPRALQFFLVTARRAVSACAAPSMLSMISIKK